MKTHLSFWLCIHIQTYNSVGEACSTHGKEENAKFFPENVSEGDHKKHRGIEWTIIIKQYGRVQ
jgi:hypothetical protein